MDHFATFAENALKPAIARGISLMDEFWPQGSDAPYGGLRCRAASQGRTVTMCDSLLMVVTGPHRGFFDATAADSGGEPPTVDLEAAAPLSERLRRHCLCVGQSAHSVPCPPAASMPVPRIVPHSV